MKPNDTIVAAATPYGFSGIAVVRLSGTTANEIVKKICQYPSSFLNRKATKVQLYKSNNKPFDSALVTFFKTPNSYTGEDVFEISCHGSPTIVETIIEEAINLGARTADPGEFTQRAFINGKLDLVQAESVAGTIHGLGEKCSRLNHRIISGELTKKLELIRKSIVDALSYVEFELDVSEEDILSGSEVRILESLSLAKNEVSSLTKSFKEGRLLNRGASVVITGPPNVGKSTLFNKLLNENKAIVTSFPGTTRDLIDAPVVYNGVSIVFSDTAGIREGEEEIEMEGIRRATEKTHKADIVLSVFDLESQPPQNINRGRAVVIPVLNKCDLYNQNQRYKIKSKINSCFFVSAKTGDGIENLKNRILKSLDISENISDSVFLITQRQYDVSKSCLLALDEAISLIKNRPISFELLSVEIRDSLDSIDRILGKTTSEEILNNVFSHFCVGK